MSSQQLTLWDNIPTGHPAWWCLENLGVYIADDTQVERDCGGYGPFATLNEALTTWERYTGLTYPAAEVETLRHVAVAWGLTCE